MDDMRCFYGAGAADNIAFDSAPACRIQPPRAQAGDTVLPPSRDGCGAWQNPAMAMLPLAIATVPMQVWDKTFDEMTALQHGTIFPELVMPFLGSEVRRR